MFTIKTNPEHSDFHLYEKRILFSLVLQVLFFESRYLHEILRKKKKKAEILQLTGSRIAKFLVRLKKELGDRGKISTKIFGELHHKKDPGILLRIKDRNMNNTHISIHTVS